QITGGDRHIAHSASGLDGVDAVAEVEHRPPTAIGVDRAKLLGEGGRHIFDDAAVGDVLAVRIGGRGVEEPVDVGQVIRLEAGGRIDVVAHQQRPAGAEAEGIGVHLLAVANRIQFVQPRSAEEEGVADAVSIGTHAVEHTTVLGGEEGVENTEPVGDGDVAHVGGVDDAADDAAAGDRDVDDLVDRVARGAAAEAGVLSTAGKLQRVGQIAQNMNACIHDRGIVQHDLGDLHGGGDGAADIAVAVVVGDEADLFGGINAGLGEIAAAAGGQTFTDIDIVDLVGVDHAGDSFNQAGEVDVVGTGQNRVDGAGG